MSTNTAVSDSCIGQRLNALEEQVESLQQANERKDDLIDALKSTVEDQRGEIDALQEHVSDQEDTDEIEDNSKRIDALSAAKDHVHDRIDDVEDRIEDHEPTSQTDESGSSDLYQTPETPLEDITAIPEHMAEDSLTANQQRARFVAQGIRDYGEKRLGDWVLSSKDIKKVLSARDGGSTHWTTVNRVIEFLTDMGNNEVREKTKHGRIVTFSEDLVGRLEQQSSSHDVVTAETGMV